MKKPILIIKLIRTTTLTILLIYLFNKVQNGKLLMIPFLICSFSLLGKNIVIFLEKEKYIKLFTNLFILGFFLFWFGLLIYLSYISLIAKNYSMIFFSIPFWLIGIKTIKRIFNKSKNNF